MSRLGISLNPLTTDDAFWRYLTLAAYYQLVLKIGSVQAEGVVQGEVGGCTPLGAHDSGDCWSWL